MPEPQIRTAHGVPVTEFYRGPTDKPSTWRPTIGHVANTAYVVHTPGADAGLQAKTVEFHVGCCPCGWFAGTTRRTSVMAMADAEDHVTSLRWDNR